MATNHDFRGAASDLDQTMKDHKRGKQQFYGRSHHHQQSRIASRNESISSGIVRHRSNKDTTKLGTFTGVFIPTTLNVLSILMFLRFGFIIGQAGILGTALLLVCSYLVDLLTTLSISAISTNGTVRGGGAYYMISRSLGPEFGGSIGVVFYIGQILNTGLNIAGFFEPLVSNFGNQTGHMAKLIPEGSGWTLLYSTVLLLACTTICSVGSSFFAKSGKVLFVVLLISVLSIPLSVFFVSPFADEKHDFALYTGVSWSTIRANFWPHFTKGAAGSDDKHRQTFSSLFGILFPATSGIFAGASMSGDLRKPSKSIPKGTLWGLLCTFSLYLLVILAVGSSVSRELLHKDIQVIQNINVSNYLILMGELSTSLYSALMGVIGASKLLQAISRDDLLPGTSYFAKGSSGGGDNPVYAILFTYVLVQVTLFFDINQIAVFITMAYLMTFVVTNLACFLLKIASAPNFRPSFKYFSSTTAGLGAFACIASMFVADRSSASAMIIVLAMLFSLIHYISPPKPWGDVSQSLIYHQVRKYLLRLKLDHVKFWRPQILLLIDDPRTSWSLIHFCNHMKKGGLYVMGHVVTTTNFQESFVEFRKQQEAWGKLRTLSGVKAFVQIGSGPDVVWGARNVYIGSGLGGMRPNITVLGFFEMRNHYPELCNARYESFQTTIDMDQLPTDRCKKEPPITVTQWVNIIEDLLTMQANVAVAKGFPRLEFPSSELPTESISKGDKKYIDLYPIQMTAQLTNENGDVTALTTNFDTYTLILQMGAILRTVPAWKQSHELRVIVFVEFEEDVDNERQRIKMLLDKLRIKANIIVRCLSSGDVPAYETIVQGKPDLSGKVSKALGNDEWWQELQSARAEWDEANMPSSIVEGLATDHQTKVSEAQMSAFNDPGKRRRRHTLSSLQKLGVSFSMQTNHISRKDIFNATSGYYDEMEDKDSDSCDESDTDYDADGYLKTASGSYSSSLVPSGVNTPSGLLQPPVITTTTTDDSTGQSPQPVSPSIISEESSQPDYFSAGYQYGRTASGASPYPLPLTYNAARQVSQQNRQHHPHHARTPSGLSNIENVSGEQERTAVRPGISRTVSGSQVPLKRGSVRPELVRTTSGPVPQSLRKSPSSNSLDTMKQQFQSASARSSPNLGPQSNNASPATTPPARPLLISRPSLMKTLQHSNSQADLTRAKKLKPNFSGLTMPETKLLDDADQGRRTIMFDDTPPPQPPKSPKVTTPKTPPAPPPMRTVTFDETTPLLSAQTTDSQTYTHQGGDDEEEDEDEDSFLSFNDLPAKAQHVILNDLMCLTSKNEAAVIFSTLPAPQLGTHESEQDSLEYVQNLELWCEDLPPTILLHSQSMTVTTAL